MHWVKNLTAVAQVTAEVHVPSQDWHRELKGSTIAAAMTQIQFLAKELPYAADMAKKIENCYLSEKYCFLKM